MKIQLEIDTIAKLKEAETVKSIFLHLYAFAILLYGI